MSERLETVLVATSLREDSRKITRLGVRLARAAGARVALVHASVMPTWYGDAALDHMGREGQALKANMNALRDSVAEEARSVGIEASELVGCFLELAPPHRAIVASARRLEADLIVLGASDHLSRRWRTLGSTAGRVLQKSPRPVLLVRGGLPLPLRRVLAPVDLSPLSGDALGCGLDKVAALCGGEMPAVEALFVLSPLERDGWAHFSGEQVDRFAREELERFLARHAGRAGASISAAVRVGEAREVISAEAESAKPDLILVGTHGRSGFERFVVGSVASEVARRSAASVLVVPPEAAARAALEAEESARTGADWAYVSDEIPTAARARAH